MQSKSLKKTTKSLTSEAVSHRRDDKRLLILDAAQKLFVRDGFAGVSMDALAQAVPVSKPTLYHHFNDKKTLFLAVMANRCGQVADRIEHILSKEKSGVEATLIAMGRHFLSIVLDPTTLNLYRIAITEARQIPELGTLFYDSGPQRCIHLFSTYLSGLHASGELNVADPERAADVFFVMLTGRFKTRLLLGMDKSISAKKIAIHVAYVSHVFLHGQQGAGDLTL